ncbi:hypothetical protein Y032_0071g517 [Ancylostoma ceylanicum]|uniref:Reverse transcriptase domain-containing protein n=1 Tax=Ancylostoma ceylanicum TaxID=53326 RepID=A0A016TX53_9BILA|nr:hypothetical protein Y032_0071g517 [Ancylostoma ceylanicum]
MAIATSKISSVVLDLLRAHTMSKKLFWIDLRSALLKAAKGSYTLHLTKDKSSKYEALLGISTIDLTPSPRLIEVLRECNVTLCLTFIVLREAFDTVETEAVLEALGNHNVPTQYIRILRELYSNFTTRISLFYDYITIDVKRGIRQGYTVSSKLFTATLEDVMRRLEWDNMEVRVDDRLLHHLCFADDIVLITPNISQAERMLSDFDDAGGKIGIQLNLTKTMFMRNGWVPDAPFSLNGTTISECSSYVYLGRGLAPELGRKK